jgi:hypothetical protein
MEKYSKDTAGYRKMIGSPQVLQDAEFEQCQFDGGALVQFDDPSCGLVVKNLLLRKCRGGAVSLHGVRFENVTIDGITNRSRLQLRSCVFERVTLRGRIGPIMTMAALSSLSAEMRYGQPFREQAVQLYSDIEWALDISEASSAMST